MVGTEIVASLKDSDGVIMESVEWIWHRSANVEFERDRSECCRKSGCWGRPPTRRQLPTLGMYLRAQATYLTDRRRDGGETETTPPVPDPAPMGFKNVKRSDVTTPVLGSPVNQAPWFKEGSSTVRHVRENEQAGVNIGAAVEAMDNDPDLTP